ncbi:Uncharacterized domain COG3236 / GTPcyclohydrolase II [Xylella phage Bacata]|nr:Uncharacterized domain COG3236 / GTPcyclohydrolase II [Xylella phage Bacata]CAA2367810.1 Uncharacterized domain COG3236 / GTPcyclohydrolase II [Xylella phage Bacata]
MKTIGSFTGPHRFLSNFWSVAIAFEGHSYRTVEHAFQAAKTFDEDERRRIRNEPDAGGAKRRGKTVTLREDWEEVKEDVMRNLLRQKFGTEPLKSKLLKTGKSKLVEGNWWGDTYWGVCDGKGKNRLGEILMEVREELRAAKEAANG